MELSDWESFINKIKALLDTTRATADPNPNPVDLAENKEESSTQTQTWLWKTNTEEKMAITSTSQSIKHPVTKSPNKTRSKDKLDQKTKDPQYNLPLLQTPLQVKKHLKTNKNLHQNQKYKKQKIQKQWINSEYLKRGKTESSSQLTKPKTQKNKPTNLEQRTNNEPPNNSVELSGLNTIKNV